MQQVDSLHKVIEIMGWQWDSHKSNKSTLFTRNMLQYISKMNTCKHIVSQTAVDPLLPSSPSLTNLGRISLKYISQTLLFILIEWAMGCNTCLQVIYAWVQCRIGYHPKSNKNTNCCYHTTSSYKEKRYTENTNIGKLLLYWVLF